LKSEDSCNVESTRPPVVICAPPPTTMLPLVERMITRPLEIREPLIAAAAGPEPLSTGAVRLVPALTLFRIAPPAGCTKLNVSPAAMLKFVSVVESPCAVLPHVRMERSAVTLMVPVAPAADQVAAPLVTVNGVVEGTEAKTGAGSIAIGPTASIAMNNLRRDN